MDEESVIFHPDLNKQKKGISGKETNPSLQHLA
jgi:hypothetical protein